MILTVALVYVAIGYATMLGVLAALARSERVLPSGSGIAWPMLVLLWPVALFSLVRFGVNAQDG